MRLYLAKIGSRSGGDLESATMLQPMFGTPEKLQKVGEAFWIPNAAISQHAVVVDGLTRELALSGQTCPRRMNEMGPWKKKRGLDAWYKVGPDLICDFCGSMHPESVYGALNDKEARFSSSTKKYKVYINRPGIINASFGGIKAYVWHMDDNLIDLVNNRVRTDQSPMINNG
jgi:hypothetical protein